MRPSSSQSLLSKAKTPVFLVTNLVNIRYLTGVEVSAGAVLVTPRGIILFVDGRYGEVAEEQMREGETKEREELASVLQRLRRCGCEAENTTLVQWRRWRVSYPNTKFVQVSGLVQSFRRSKDPEELERFRRAQRLTRLLLRKVPSVLRGAITERELAWKLRAWTHALGGDDLAFDPIVAFGSHTSRPHHRPTTRALKRGDLVQIDVGVRFRGYCADQSAVYFTGRKTAEQERALTAVHEAKEAATKAVRAGVTTHTLDRIARNVLRGYDLEKFFVHSLGHGIGLEIHEGVTLSQRRPAQKLLKHEIITIEPGVYFPGKFGIRLEDEVVVGT